MIGVASACGLECVPCVMCDVIYDYDQVTGFPLRMPFGCSVQRERHEHNYTSRAHAVGYPYSPTWRVAVVTSYSLVLTMPSIAGLEQLFLLVRLKALTFRQPGGCRM